MTPALEKNAIDQDISNKAGQPKAISPAILGSRLKSMVETLTDFAVGKTDKAQPNGIATLDENGKVPTEQLPEMSGGGSGAETPNIKRFPKDASLTEAHIGLLAMQQVTVLNNPPSSQEDFEFKAVLCNTTPATPNVKGRFELDFSGLFDVSKETIQNNQNSKLFQYSVSFHDEYGDYRNRYCGILVSDLFYAGSGNPYGTPDENGILEFADNTEKINALNWALFNAPETNSFNGRLADVLNVITALYHYSDSNSFKMVVEDIYNKVESSYFESYTFGYFKLWVSNIVERVNGSTERVDSVILGTITAIDGEDVLIDTSPVQTVKIATAEDGAMGVLPVPSLTEMGNQILMPWRNGRVIDLNGWFMTQQPSIDENFVESMASTRGCFTALTAGQPGGDVLARII